MAERPSCPGGLKITLQSIASGDLDIDVEELAKLF